MSVGDRKATLPGRAAVPLLLMAAGVVAACGGADLDPTAAAALIEERFPGAEVRVDRVEVTGEEATAEASFDGDAVRFLFRAGPAGWILHGVEQGGVVHAVEDLELIPETMARMRELAAALARYRQAHGAYPAGRTAEVLQRLVPDYYPSGRPLADAWGRPFSYASEGPDYTLISAGADGALGSRDDVILVSGIFVEGEGPPEP